MNKTFLSEAMKTEEQRASELHGMVMAARDHVVDAICAFAMHLKAMRDGKLYLVLGYDNFDDYIELAVNIGKSQVYNYIRTYEKLGSTVMQENAGLNITKLELLTKVPDIERADFIENNDLMNMSTTEIEKLIKSSKEQVEQISFLQEKVAEMDIKLDGEVKDNKINEQVLTSIEKQRDELQAELKAMKSKPIDVAVAEPTQAELDKIIADIEAQTEAKYEKNKQVEIDKARAEGEKIAAEQLQAALATADGEKAELLQKTQRLAKELEVKSDGDIVKVMCYFESFKGDFIKMIETITAVEDVITKEKLSKAVTTYVNQSILPVLSEV